ncbi:MAG: hypothetical protein HY318_04105 [Armatimonadetes bacterium]|nr:hypothetical protein [Armatimonadota bacterium]
MHWMEDRAEEFADILTNVAGDENKVIRTMIHFGERRPLKDSDLADWIPCLPSVETKAGFYCYEDAGMTTGAFLASQSLRFRVTGDPGAKQNADNAFQGIRWIYDLGKPKTEGYYPKPYDKKISDQISRDQYIYTMNGLVEYYSIADEKAQSQIRRMLAKMAEYWISIDYTQSYFGLPPSSHLADFMGSLFLGIMHIPYGPTGDMKFLKEYERLFHEENLGKRMPETLRTKFLSEELYDGATYYRQNENPIMMKCLAIDRLWDTDPGHRDLWAASLKQFWDDEMIMTLDRDDALNYEIMGLDVKTNMPFLTKPGVIPEIENPLKISSLNWGGLRKTAGSSQSAYSCTVTGSRLGNQEAADTARLILGRMDYGKFRGYTVPDDSHLPPGHAWMTNVLYCFYLSSWLLAYWLGRERDLW